MTFLGHDHPFRCILLYPFKLILVYQALLENYFRMFPNGWIACLMVRPSQHAGYEGMRDGTLWLTAALLDGRPSQGGVGSLP